MPLSEETPFRVRCSGATGSRGRPHPSAQLRSARLQVSVRTVSRRDRMGHRQEGGWPRLAPVHLQGLGAPATAASGVTQLCPEGQASPTWTSEAVPSAPQHPGAGCLPQPSAWLWCDFVSLWCGAWHRATHSPSQCPCDKLAGTLCHLKV